MTWLALGLVVALALAWTTRTATDASSRPSTPAADQGLRASTGAAVDEPPWTRSTDPTSARPATDAKKDGIRATTTASSTPVPTTTVASSTTTTTTTTTIARRPTPPARSPSPAARPAAAAPTSRVIELSGELAFPDDVGTVYPLSAAPGIVSVRGSWSGGPLVLTLSCGASVDSESGAAGATAALRSQAVNCSLGLSEPPAARRTVRYTLVADVPAAGAPS